ncbi:MAG: hypothetical protein WCO28_02895 [Bacteroidota bacterium]
MNSVRTDRFKKAYTVLPLQIKKSAQKSFKIWKVNPTHPSLHFKKIHKKQEIYSIRITLDYRALAVKSEETYIWFWIGNHREYDELILSL